MPFDGVRLNVTQAGDTGAPVVGELRLYDTVGSATNLVVASTGTITATASSEVSSSKGANQAFDDDVSTRWESNDIASVGSPVWLQGIFTNAVTIAEVGIVATITFGSLIARHPEAGTIELRDSSTGTWSEVATFSGHEHSGGDENRVAVTVAASSTHNVSGSADVPLPTASGTVTFLAANAISGAANVPLPTASGTVTFTPVSTHNVSGAANVPLPTASGTVSTSETVTPPPETVAPVVKAAITSNRVWTLTTQYGSSITIGLGQTPFPIFPEKDSPIGDADIELVRRFSEDIIESTGDGLPKPELWAWQGTVLGRTPTELSSNKARLARVIQQCIRVTRADGAFIDISKGSTPAFIAQDPVFDTASDVTFVLAARLPYWLGEDTRTWSTFFDLPYPRQDGLIVRF